MGVRGCVLIITINKETMKDQFPIPVIEKLLDELNGAIIFSKIDLRYRYHEI